MVQGYSDTQRGVFEKVFEYKYVVLAITVLFLLGALLYTSVAQKLYRSDATIEILPKNTLIAPAKNSGDDGLSYERYFQTQMEFLKSRSFISSVVKKLSLNTKIYKKGFLSSYQLLDEAPFLVRSFDVDDESLYGRFFKIEVLDEGSYTISLVSDKFFKKPSRGLKYSFGKSVKTKFLSFKLVKSESFSKGVFYLKVVKPRLEVDRCIKSLRVQRRSDKSSLIELSYDDNSPLRVKRFLDSVLKVYKESLDSSKNSEIKNYKSIVEDELKKIKQKLEKK